MLYVCGLAVVTWCVSRALWYARLRSPHEYRERFLQRLDREERHSFPPHTVPPSRREPLLKNRTRAASCLHRDRTAGVSFYFSSYCFRSFRVANRALIIRVRGSLSVYETTSNRKRSDIPNTINRCSLSEWSGSGMFIDNGSPKAVTASAKETPCLLRLACAFFASHSKL
jgi:hypothetical protein